MDAREGQARRRTLEGHEKASGEIVSKVQKFVVVSARRINRTREMGELKSRSKSSLKEDGEFSTINDGITKQDLNKT